jgi:hypothetical protein
MDLNDMVDMSSWMLSKEGSKVLIEVREAIQMYEKDLLEGDLIFSPSNELLAREYARTRGILEGLKMLEKIIINQYKENEVDDV